jgi:thioredoxin
MRFLFLALVLISLESFSQSVTTVPVEEFEKQLDSTHIQLLDVRKPEEYKSGHLHGAFQADWLDKKQFEERVQYLDKAKPVYVYCLAGSRSAAAANWLAEKGFTTVNMQGGINAWKKEGKPLETNTNVEQMKDEEYTQLIQSNSLVLIDFGAEWCIPCKKMEPVLTKIQQEHSEIKLIKIDGGIETELMKKYNIEGLPVFILYKNGKEVWRHEGIADKKEFEKAIKKNS